MYNLTGYEYEPSRSACPLGASAAPNLQPPNEFRQRAGLRFYFFVWIGAGIATGTARGPGRIPPRGRLLASDFLCRVLVASRVSEERNV